MKTNRMLATFLIGAVMVSASYAEDVTAALEVKTQAAEQMAKKKSGSIESIALAVADAVKSGAAPSTVMARVLAARETWTAAQVAFLYKTVLMSSPELSSSFSQDVKAFEEAGKPSHVAQGAPEGVKLLALLAAVDVNADAVLASILADHEGVVTGVTSVAPLRDVTAGSTTRRQRPSLPTPPATSSDN